MTSPPPLDNNRHFGYEPRNDIPKKGLPETGCMSISKSFHGLGLLLCFNDEKGKNVR